MERKNHRYIRDVALLSLGYAAACFILYMLLTRLAPDGLGGGRAVVAYLMFAALAGVFLILLWSRRFEKSIWGAVAKPADRYSFSKRLLISLGVWLLIALLGSKLQGFIVDLMLERRYAAPSLYPDFYSPAYRLLYQTAGDYLALACMALLLPAAVISNVRLTLRLHREQNNGGQSVWEEERI
jgi:hypothetical protein